MQVVLLRKTATKVVRPWSDRGSKCTDKDRSDETDNRALISAITLLSTTSFHNSGLLDDELATVPSACFMCYKWQS